MKVGYCEKCGQRVMIRDPEAAAQGQVFCDECREDLFGASGAPAQRKPGASSSAAGREASPDAARRPKAAGRRGRESRSTAAAAGGSSGTMLGVGIVFIILALIIVAVLAWRMLGGGGARAGTPAAPSGRAEGGGEAEKPLSKPSVPLPEAELEEGGPDATKPVSSPLAAPSPALKPPDTVTAPVEPAPDGTAVPSVGPPVSVPAEKPEIEKPEPARAEPAAVPAPPTAEEPATPKSFGGVGGTSTITADEPDKNIRDTMLRVQQPDNNGARNFDDMLAGNDSPWTSYSLLKIDLSSLPADAKITEARLELHCFNTYGSRSVTLYPIMKEWDWGSACFNKRKDKETWNDGGKAFRVGAGTADYDISAGVKVPAVSQGVVSWDVTDITRKWVNGSLPNNGLVLIADAPKSEMKFRSTNYKVAAERPRFVIKYTGGWAGGEDGKLPAGVKAMPIPAETARMITEAKRRHNLYDALGSTAVLCSRYRFDEAAERLKQKSSEDELLKSVLSDLERAAAVMKAVEETLAGLKGKSLSVDLGRGRVEGTVEDCTAGTIRLRTAFGTPSMLSLRQAPLELLRKWAGGADERDALLLVVYMGADLPEGVDESTLSEGARLVRAHKDWAANESAAERAFRQLQALRDKKDWGRLIVSAVEVARKYMGTYEVGVERRLLLARLLREALRENAGKPVEGAGGPLVPDELEWLLYQGGGEGDGAPDTDTGVGDVDI